MHTIRARRVSMRPRIYFIAGSVLMIFGVAASIASSVFLISLMRFLLKTHGPMGAYRLSQLLSAFPWWAPVLAACTIISGILMLKRYDFSYKRNFLFISIGFVLAVIAAGWVIDAANVDAIWFRQGPMRGIMRQYMQQTSAPFPTGPGMHRPVSP